VVRRAQVAARLVALLALAAWAAAATGADRPVVAALVGVGAASALLLTRRQPLLCLLAVTAGLLFSEALAGRAVDDPYLVMLAWALYGVGRFGRPRSQVLVGAVVLLLVVGAATAEGTTLPADVVFPLLLFAAPWLLGRAVRNAESRAELERERAEALDRSQEAQLQSAAQEERLRIARELHDVVAHSVSAVSLQAQVLRREVEAGAPVTAAELASIEATARGAMTEVRAMLGVLRPACGPAATAPSAGVGDVDGLVAAARAAGQEVVMEQRGEAPPLPPGLSLTVFRLLQESLTNARRHGSTGPTHVALHWDADTARLAVTNPLSDRVPAQRDGHGVTGMRERTEAYGGQLEAGPDGAGAWRVRAELPLVRT
jgi:signal transduction histidine kinase